MCNYWYIYIYSIYVILKTQNLHAKLDSQLLPTFLWFSNRFTHGVAIPLANLGIPIFQQLFLVLQRYFCELDKLL